MPALKQHCSCGALKRAKASCCRACWSKAAKEGAQRPSACACGSPKRLKASCCRTCWLAATGAASQPTLCACGASIKRKKALCCRACWLAAKARAWQQQTERRCSRCRRIRAVEDFVRERARRGSWCSDCRRDYNRTRESILIKLRCRLRRQYGITLNEYMTIWNLQSGRCASCLERLEFYGRDTHLDHCHSTGQVRGLLCRCCNQTAGFAKDAPITLRRLADYLEHAGLFNHLETP